MARQRIEREAEHGAAAAGRQFQHALRLLDADPARASALAARLNQRFGDGRVVVTDDVAGELASADGLIQADCTPPASQGGVGNVPEVTTATAGPSIGDGLMSV